MTIDAFNPALGGSQTHARTPVADDMAMLRAASELTRDLTAPRPLIYWSDFLASALIGYGAMAFAVLAPSTGRMLAAALVSVLALYRAGSFIHELTHIRHAAVPGFRLGWNLLLGIPLLMPSFMYEGLHSLHHARTRYGTAEDPEYLPLALMKPWTLPLFVVVAGLAPFALIVRFGLLAPASLLVPPLRTLVVARWSGLVINPLFRRKPAEGELRRNWLVQEVGAALWAMTIIIGIGSGLFNLRVVAICIGIVSASVVLNQIRTLVAHLWENDGDVLTQTAQFLDSVNVPPPGTLAALWAPVGLRYHAIHHLLPGLPYHSLGEAHRRLSSTLPPESAYHRANHAGLPSLVARLVGSTTRGHAI